MNPSGILQSLLRGLRTFGPYALLELVMPGGTLLALLLYVYRRRAAGVSTAGTTSRTFCMTAAVDFPTAHSS
jgi:hypothetical protein